MDYFDQRKEKQVFKDDAAVNSALETKLAAKNLLSSKQFLAIAWLYTISFVLSVIQVFFNFAFQNLISLILPVLLLIGVWKTYTEMSEKDNYNTEGLRLIKGVMTFMLVLIGIVAGLLFILMFLSPVAFIMIFLLLIVIGLLFYGMYCFRKSLEHMIYSVEYGQRDTDHYIKASNFIILGIVITIIIFLFFMVGGLAGLDSEIFQKMLEEQGLETITAGSIVFLGISSTLNIIFSINLAFFIRNAHQTIQQIEVKYFLGHNKKNEYDY